MGDLIKHNFIRVRGAEWGIRNAECQIEPQNPEAGTTEDSVSEVSRIRIRNRSRRHSH